MNKLQKYVDRLTKEWLTYGKLIVAVDFDDTISPWSLNNFDDCNYVISRLLEYQRQGIVLIINTACRPDRFEHIKHYCSSKGLVVHSINENPIDLPYGNNGKVYANLFIDDRAGLLEALNIADLALINVRLASRHIVENSEFSQFEKY